MITKRNRLILLLVIICIIFVVLFFTIVHNHTTLFLDSESKTTKTSVRHQQYQQHRQNKKNTKSLPSTKNHQEHYSTYYSRLDKTETENDDYGFFVLSPYDRIAELKKHNAYPRRDMNSYLERLSWLFSSGNENEGPENTEKGHNNRSSSSLFFTSLPSLSASASKKQQQDACDRVAGDSSLRNHWRTHGRRICTSNSNSTDDLILSSSSTSFATASDDNSGVFEFVLDHLDLNPSLKWYKDVHVGLFSSLDHDRLSQKHEKDGAVLFDEEETKKRQKLVNELPFQILKVEGCSEKKEDEAKILFTAESGKRDVRPEWITNIPFDKRMQLLSLKNADQKIDLDDNANTNTIFIKVHRFHLGNPYEEMHSFLNYYLLLKSFILTDDDDDRDSLSLLKNKRKNIQFIFTDEYESTLRDDQFWNSFTLNQREPIYRYAGRDELSKTRMTFQKFFQKTQRHDSSTSSTKNILKVKNLIEGPSTGTSVLTSSASPLHGRMLRHDCSSSLTRNATRWMRKNFELLGELPPPLMSPSSKETMRRRKTTIKRIEVVYCSRSVHPQAGGRLIWPNRVLYREIDFVLGLQKALGPDFRVRVVDFGRLDGPQSIAAIETAQVLIGLHGAGLVFGMFLKHSDAAIFELFGDDRGNENHHYQNIARFHNLQYYAMNRRFRFERESLSWWGSSSSTSSSGQQSEDAFSLFSKKSKRRRRQQQEQEQKAKSSSSSNNNDNIIISANNEFRTLVWEKELPQIIVDRIFELPWKREVVEGGMRYTPRNTMGKRNC